MFERKKDINIKHLLDTHKLSSFFVDILKFCLHNTSVLVVQTIKAIKHLIFQKYKSMIECWCTSIQWVGGIFGII